MKIIITGSGGEGIKFLAKKLSDLLLEKNYEVSLMISYDAQWKAERFTRH